MGRKTKFVLTVGAAGIFAWATSKVVAKPVPREGKKALDFDSPVILAHRGGLSEAPENTLAAFTNAADLGVNGFAIDVRLTKDEEIVVFHDEYLERTTDLVGKVADFTLSELKEADAGHNFTDQEGIHRFRGLGEKLLSLEELLQKFPEMFVSINMKESPETYEGSLIPSKLWRLLEKLHAEDRVAVTSSYDEQIDRFNLYAQNRVATGAGEDEVKQAYASFTSQFGHLYNPRADMFRIPKKLGIFSLGGVGFINFLTKLNVPVYYEDIDDRDSITTLINAGAAGFITNKPSLAIQIIHEHTKI